jgi:hypothetical protein
MRVRAAILLSVYIIVEVMYLILGDSSKTGWNVAYFFNQSILIIGILSILRGYFDTVFIDIAIGLNIVKLTYNLVFAIDKEFAARLNTCFWIGLLIVAILTLVLINKWRKT